MAKPSQKSAPQPTAYRIRFVAQSEAAAKPENAPEVFRRFRDPSAAVALRQALPRESLDADKEDTEDRDDPHNEKRDPDHLSAASSPRDTLRVLFLPTGTPESEVENAHRWLAGADPGSLITACSGAQSISFRPGQAVITAPAEQREETLAAVTDFAFYECRLRLLEAEVAQSWPELEADMPQVSKLDEGQKKLWPALYRKLSHQHVLNMTATRLDHRIALLTQGRPPELGKLLARLRARARLPTRVEQLHGHLEVRDGVYDQIGYRLSDHRQMRASLVIEIVIVALLLMEVGISLYNLVSEVK